MTTDHGPIWYRLSGDSSQPLALLVPGFFIPANETWQTVEQDLIQKNYQTLIFDLWGRGRSSAGPAQYSADTFADQINQLLIKLNRKPVLVISFSMGVVFACHWVNLFSQNQPRLIAISPVGLDQKLWVRLMNWMGTPDWLVTQPLLLKITIYLTQMLPSFKFSFLFRTTFWKMIAPYLEKKGAGLALKNTLTNFNWVHNRLIFEKSLQSKLMIEVLQPQLDAYERADYILEKQNKYSNLKIKCIKKSGHAFFIEDPAALKKIPFNL